VHFFPPDPLFVDAASSAAFNEEVDNHKEFEDLDLELTSKNLDDFFATLYDDNASASCAATCSTDSSYQQSLHYASTSCAATCSTDSSYQQSLHYSCDPTLSDHSILSGIESRGSVNDGLHSTHTSSYSAVYSNAPLSIPPHNPAEVISDYGTLDVDPNSIANDIAVQQSAASVVALPPDHVIPDPDAQMALEPDKPFKCPCESQSPLEL
jgi:hypothetical protein